jgi:hypothetical protein
MVEFFVYPFNICIEMFKSLYIIMCMKQFLYFFHTELKNINDFNSLPY